jgi:cysteinyl-tRNA synthetase
MRLYNTLTRTTEEFVPRDEGRVGMYVCGPTVQDVAHLGHGRADLVPDVLRRYLEWRGYEVLHVRNFTDVDDKIIVRAAEEGRLAVEVAQRNARIYEQDMARFGLLPPHVAPRATGHIIEMQQLIERLVELGSAYESGGDVFFSVRSFERYGRLSGRDVDELRAGARVEPDERKRDPADFALWKAAKPGEPRWPSPWGDGRPGWHIECSAMAATYLGEGFDIHAGGLDLIFPHHENEIAQSEAATKQPFARYWVHNGLLNVGGQKMSKSLGNFLTLAEALDRYGAHVLRLWFLSSAYRAPVDLDPERLADAAAGLERWTAFLRATAPREDGDPTLLDPALPGGSEPDDLAGLNEARVFRERFVEAMDDDLATPRAQAVLFDLVRAGNAHLEAGRTAEAHALREELLELSGVLGFRLEGGAAAGGAAGADLVRGLVEELLALHTEARSRRDFAAADGIRDRLAELGVVVEDRPDGPEWHLAGPS